MNDHWFYRIGLKLEQTALSDVEPTVAHEQLITDQEGTPTEQTTAPGSQENVIADDEKSLANQEQALEEKKNPIADGEKTLAEQEKAMADRENALAARETALAIREQALEQQETAMREREVLLSKRKDPDRDLSKEMKELIATYKSFADQVKQTGRDVVSLGNEVSGWHQDSLEALCSLCRDMMLARDERLLLWAQRLDLILERKFHVESLEPRPGDDYNPEHHIRLDASRTGRKVLECRAKGWQREDELLLRAVVETE